ncbi:hypothetical protein M431DRAFT_522865 [Trichoderma harzianum CBS 226.95]|uniref:BTB domain-containing protein n=1 Tax=Trichoderma harzianum CBS 226.95 TaxID=983964 RepID=A0A2T4A4B7_TRIHA|nr:hypothetical protein M431DRAFT_522865 [Trichoderma harzianum CBS 226.95]PTB51909.1 hypothetical protein M431DRAFT_522865 [Trichoderma harzianum CBS 226.95]
MENPNDTQTNTIVEIAPDGDLILIVGPEEAKLHVDSTLLRAASKPFSAMFRPDWKEGHDLLDGDRLTEIPLPEDNAAALKIMCSVIHHKASEVPRTLAAGDVLAVAVAADKYDCVEALIFASDGWLRPFRDEAGNLMLLTAAAYLFQNARAFEEITKALILDYKDPYLTLSCREVESAMPWKVFCLLEEQRGSARLRVADVLMAGVNDWTGHCCHKCGWTSKYAYAYIKLLESERLWPAKLPRISISEALQSAERMRDPIPEESSAACTYGYKHTAPAYRRNRTSSLDDFNKSIGLCLHCVRSGSMDSNCSERSHSC